MVGCFKVVVYGKWYGCRMYIYTGCCNIFVESWERNGIEDINFLVVNHSTNLLFNSNTILHLLLMENCFIMRLLYSPVMA